MNKLFVFVFLFTIVLVVNLSNGAVINSEIFESDEDLNIKWNEFKNENRTFFDNFVCNLVFVGLKTGFGLVFIG